MWEHISHTYTSTGLLRFNFIVRSARVGGEGTDVTGSD